MWGALCKIFKASTFRTDEDDDEEEEEVQVQDEGCCAPYEVRMMANDAPQLRLRGEHDPGKAKQRASVLWLIAKANNNVVPDDLREPYYKDHEDQDQLKPVVIHALASAEYYCLALGVIYADPNYHRLNHWGVIQVLARKGIYVVEPSDVALTETVLIQTSPMRMSAHMAVIEALMALYIKETITTERVVHSVKRLCSSFSSSADLPSNAEEGLVLWVNKVCVKMKHRIEEELNANDPEIQMDTKKEPELESQVKNGSEVATLPQKPTSLPLGTRDSEGQMPNSQSGLKKIGRYLERVPPTIPVLHDLEDLSNGCCLATVISFYCPTAFSWKDISYNASLSMADSLYNLQLVQKFCCEYLPYNPCTLSIEDLIYFHSSIHQNVVAFLADLFFLFELKPVKCVTSPGAKHEMVATEAEVPQNGRGFHPISPAGRRSIQQVSPIPDLRSSSYSSMPDINRISPRSHSCPQTIKEPMFPRRQVVTHLESRTLERPKRYSFHEAPRNQASIIGGHNRSVSADAMGGAIRRTHSLLDINKTILDRSGDVLSKAKDGRRGSPQLETRPHGDVDSEPEVYYVHHSLNVTPAATRKFSDGQRQLSANEMNAYSRRDGPLEDAIPTSFKFDEKEDSATRYSRRQDEEPLLPARLKPAKEKNNLDSKMEERGEKEKSYSYSHEALPRGKPNVRYSQMEDARDGKDYAIDNEFMSGPQTMHVPKYMKCDDSKVLSGDTVISSALGIKLNEALPRGKNMVPYEGYYDNRDVEEQLRAQNLARTTHPSKADYLYLDIDKEKNECNLMDNEKQALQTSFAQLSKLRDQMGGGINLVYMQHEKDNNYEANRHPLKSSFLQRKNSGEKKITTFATLPSQTTWQQRQNVDLTTNSDRRDASVDSNNEMPLPTQLHNVRMKLEEKRRRIENEKRKMELSLSRARQKVGKAAFLQTISRGKGSGRSTPDSGASGDLGSPTVAVEPQIGEDQTDGKDYTIQEIAENLNLVQNKWFDSQISADTLSGPDSERPSPDVEGVTFEEYTRSLDQLSTNLSDIQSDIRRLTHQQDQIQKQMQNGMQNQQPRSLPTQPQPNYYASSAHLQQWMAHAMPSEQDYMRGMSMQADPNQRLGQWGMAPAAADSCGMMPPPQQQQQHVNPPPAEPYPYLNEHGYIVPTQPSGGFSLHQPQVSHSAENLTEPYANYYSMNPYGKQMPYQPIPARYVMQQQQAPAAAPFHLHSESPPGTTQPPKTFQRPTQSQTPPMTRPTTLPASLASKSMPVESPSEASMEPQMVHFIEDQSPMSERTSYVSKAELPKRFPSHDSLSGTATYRVRESGSPTRTSLTKTFRVPKPKPASPSQELLQPEAIDADDDSTSSEPSSHKGSDKGFFVSLDDDHPKRVKPPLRVRKVPRNSPHPSQGDEVDHATRSVRSSSIDRSFRSAKDDYYVSPSKLEDEFDKVTVSENSSPARRVLVESPAVGFTIEHGAVEQETPDDDEMAKKRERILLNALKRKEQQEVVRVKKEAENAQRREQERMKQELTERKREDERARRQAIFEQYKQRKAMEEQESDKIDTARTSTLPKTKSKMQKPRPKSLHESAMTSADSESCNLASCGSRGSQISLTGRGSGSSSLIHYGETDSGLGRSTPPRRAPSPGHSSFRHPLSPSTHLASLPPGLVARRGGPISDTASDTCSTTSSTLEYTGPKLFKQPTAKSNRGIIINAINSVLAGAVNNESKKRALEEIAQSDSKHFLILFRDSGCQFRALYSYSPDKEEVFKLFGIGPKQVSETMIDRFYKYNSGGKSFMEIQTKHLTVTIDAFTIHNTLWQGKRGAIPKKDLY